MTLERDSHPLEGADRSTGNLGSTGPVLALPPPADPSRTVRWTGEAFDLDGNAVRVLGYAVVPSGCSEELALHEEVADCGLVAPDMLEHVEHDDDVAELPA